jgi:hypothetical protein
MEDWFSQGRYDITGVLLFPVFGEVGFAVVVMLLFSTAQISCACMNI